MSYYCHQVPGRVRVKSPRLKSNPEAGNALRDLLQDLPGLRETAVNPLTGSVVVTFDSARLGGNQVLNRLTEHGYFDPTRAVSNDQVINSAATKAGKVVGKAVLGACIEKAFEGSALSLLAVLI